MVSGDSRTMSDAYNYSIQASHDDRMTNTIFATFIRPNATGADPLNFGNMVWIPSLSLTCKTLVVAQWQLSSWYSYVYVTLYIYPYLSTLKLLVLINLLKNVKVLKWLTLTASNWMHYWLISHKISTFGYSIYADLFADIFKYTLLTCMG